MKKGHLRLVVSDNTNCNSKNRIFDVFKNLKNRIKCQFISRREKIYILKDMLTKIYRDYEITTGICDVPYYLRAELKLNEIIKNGKIDYYYSLFERHFDK